jgi:hypothetical protein
MARLLSVGGRAEAQSGVMTDSSHDPLDDASSVRLKSEKSESFVRWTAWNPSIRAIDAKLQLLLG